MPSNSGGRYPAAPLSWSIWGLAATFYLIGFFHRVAPGVLTDELTRDFGLGAAALGNLSAFYFYTYVAMQVPTGVLADRFGPRCLLVWGAVTAALGAVLFAVAPGPVWAAVGRALIGGSVAVAFVCMLKLAAHWMDARRFSLASGLAVCVGMVGALSAGVPLRIWTDWFDWREVMIVVGLVTLMLGFVIACIVRDDPADYGYRSRIRTGGVSTGREKMVSAMRQVLPRRNVQLLVLIPAGITGPMLTFTGLWGVPFLTTHYSMSTGEAAFHTSAMLVGWAVGGPVFGWLSGCLQSCRGLYLVGVGSAMSGWGIVFLIPAVPASMLLWILALVGFASGCMVLSFSLARESVPAHLAATVSGVVNTGVMIGPMLMQPAIGWMLEWRWSGAELAGTPIYDFSTYQTAFLLMLIWSVLSFLLLFFVRETGEDGVQAH